MATINKLLKFQSLSIQETSWRGEVIEVNNDLQKVKVKRGNDFTLWITNSLTLVVGDEVLAKDKMVTKKLPSTTDYITVEL